MFRRNIDELDEYSIEREEYARESKQSKPKDKNLAKNTKVGVQEFPGGIYKYKTHHDWKILFAIGLVIVFPITILLISILVDGTQDILPKLMGILICVVFGVMIAISRGVLSGGINSSGIMLTPNSIVINPGKSKEAVYSYDDYKDMICKRIYGKNHSYSGTRYTMIFEDEYGKESKHQFCSSAPHTVSDFEYRVRKRKAELRGDTYFESKEFPSRTFEWNERLAKANGINIKVVASVPLILIFTILVIGFFVTPAEDRVAEMMPGLIFFFVVLVVVIVLMTCTSLGVMMRYPERMTFDGDGIRIDDKTFRAGDIKRVYITRNGVGNPNVVSNSTFYLVTDEGEYRYKVGMFHVSSSRRIVMENTRPDWEYINFYDCFRDWSRFNGVEFVDYLI